MQGFLTRFLYHCIFFSKTPLVILIAGVNFIFLREKQNYLILFFHIFGWIVIVGKNLVYYEWIFQKKFLVQFILFKTYSIFYNFYKNRKTCLVPESRLALKFYLIPYMREESFRLSSIWNRMILEKPINIVHVRFNNEMF